MPTLPGQAATAVTPAVHGAAAPIDALPALPPASPWRRTMGALYEGVILFGVLFFFGYLFSALTQHQGQAGPLARVFQLYLFVLLGAYFTGFWSGGRRTLPMKTMDLLLVRARDDAPTGMVRAAARYAVASLLFWGLAALAWKTSALVLVLWLAPYVWCLFDRDRQTLYDRLAGTRLVVVQPQRGSTTSLASRTQSTA